MVAVAMRSNSRAVRPSRAESKPNPSRARRRWAAASASYVVDAEDPPKPVAVPPIIVEGPAAPMDVCGSREATPNSRRDLSPRRTPALAPPVAPPVPMAAPPTPPPPAAPPGAVAEDAIPAGERRIPASSEDELASSEPKSATGAPPPTPPTPEVPAEEGRGSDPPTNGRTVDPEGVPPNIPAALDGWVVAKGEGAPGENSAALPGVALPGGGEDTAAFQAWVDTMAVAGLEVAGEASGEP